MGDAPLAAQAAPAAHRAAPLQHPLPARRRLAAAAPRGEPPRYVIAAIWVAFFSRWQRYRCQQATAAEEAASHPYLAATVGAEMGEEQLREMRSSYYGLITECDENLGRVFEALERSGQHDNTVIVFTTVLIPQHRIDAWRCGLPGLSDAGVW